LCVVGAYGVEQSMLGVYVMLIAGVIGFALRRYGFSPAPIIMGLVLGKLVENSLAQSMIIFDQNWLLFFERPIVVLFFSLSLISIFAAPVAGLVRKTAKEPASANPIEE
ncbi:MAG: tripartite tricarboxylate transporter permease, partial [Acidobacteriota bacterium]